MKNSKLYIALLSVVLISACSSEPAETLQASIDQTVQPRASFDPSNSIIPFPNNLLFSGSLDGTLNIPVVSATDLSDPKVAMNGVDGFSTVAPMTSGFSTAIDAATVNGTSVKVYEVTLSVAGGPVATVVSQLTFGVDYFAALSSVDLTQSTVAILPLKPLKEKTSYAVVITDDLMSTGGQPFGASPTYLLIENLANPLVFGDPTLPGGLQSLTSTELASFESLRLIVRGSEATVDAFDGTITAADIIQSWSFTTQSIGDVLAATRTAIRGAAVPASSLALAPAGLENSALGAAKIYVGTVTIPYYLTAASGVNDPTPLASFWKGAAGSNLTQFNTTAVSTSSQTIPLMVSVPVSAMPGAGYPIVIYQHGITTNRATMLAVADAFAAAGIAVAAIDMPLHGLTGNETDGTQFYRNAGNERTFDLDLVTQDPTTGDITASVPDSITDTSGRHYINLTNMLNTRDNLRQSVSDLFTLAYAITNLNAAGNTFDTNKIYFLGHSLGAIVGTTFAALEPTVRDTVFAFGGGGIPKILDGSAAFSPSIVAGLAVAGVIKGTPDYESFFGAAQTVVDTVDPVNHAAALAIKAPAQGILYFEIVGGPSSPSDLVVPNAVPDGNDSSSTVAAPLSGTEKMLTLLGLTAVNTSQAGTDLKHSVKFVVGNHSSLLSAAADDFNSAATNTIVRTELQTLAATFVLRDGATVTVTDPTVLQ